MHTVETLVLEMIGEDPDSPDVFTDTLTGMAQIRDSINDAIEEIAMLTGGYRETYLLPLRAGRCFYRLDHSAGYVAWLSDVRLQSRNWRLEQTDLTRLRAYDPRWLYNNGDPRAYFPIGLDFIAFWPIPSADGEVAELNAVIVPARYSEDTDRLFVRKNLEYAAAHFAVGEFYASRGDAKSALDHHARYAQVFGLDLPYSRAAEYIAGLKTVKEPWPRITG